MIVGFIVVTINNMKVEYDPVKSEKNISDRGFSFELATGFGFDTALIVEDTRQDYGEQRYQALGHIDNRLYALVFTPRGTVVRVISLRKANAREVKSYEKNTKS